MLYNAAFLNEIANIKKYNVHKSKKHSDGKFCFDDENWFVVQATPPAGQITNHYEMKYWTIFKCEERDKADEWDGHTANDVVNRLLEFVA